MFTKSAPEVRNDPVAEMRDHTKRFCLLLLVLAALLLSSERTRYSSVARRRRVQCLRRGSTQRHDGSSSAVELVPDDSYTLEIRLSHPDDNHCILDPVWTTWDLPQRERGCLPEDNQVTRTFSTRRLWLTPPVEEVLQITVTDSAHEDAGAETTLFTKRYVVRWASQ